MVEVSKPLTYLFRNHREQLNQMCLFRAQTLGLFVDTFTPFVLGPVRPAVHHVGKLVGVVLVADFVHADRVVIKQVDELSKLDDDHHSGQCPLRILLFMQCFATFIEVRGNLWQQHLVDLVSTGFALEVREKELFEHVD